MANKSVLTTLALTFFGSSLALLTPLAIAAPIVKLDCSGLTGRHFPACVSAKLNYWSSKPAGYYCRMVNGPRAVVVRVNTGSFFYSCDLRQVVDHR
jgi:hypothetical protein